VKDVEVVETKRYVYADVAPMLSGRVGFEAAVVSYANYEALRGGPAELVPRAGVVEQLRAVKEDGELEAIRKAAEISDEAYERLSRERFIGRTEQELACAYGATAARMRGRAPLVRRGDRQRPERSPSARRSDRPEAPRGRAGGRRLRDDGAGLRLRLHADIRQRARCRPS